MFISFTTVKTVSFLQYRSTDICELHDKIIACMDVLDTSTGKELLPVYNDYDKSVHLTSITTHMPWCITIRVPTYSSYLRSSSSGAWSRDDTLGWSWMFRESAGTGMENMRMAGPGDAAWWNHVGSAATTSPTTAFIRSSSYWISGGALIVPGGPGVSACHQLHPNPPFARLSGSSSKRFP